MYLTDSHDSSPRITSKAEVLNMSEWKPCAKSYPNLCPVQNQLTWKRGCQERQKETWVCSSFAGTWHQFPLVMVMSPKNTVGIHKAVCWRFFPSKPASSCISQSWKCSGKSLDGSQCRATKFTPVNCCINMNLGCSKRSLRITTGNCYFNMNVGISHLI